MIKCIAVDDEPLALEQLTGYIARVPFLQLIASCQDAFSAMQVLSEEEVDLMFVDIHMPDLNGLSDLVRSLVVEAPDCVYNRLSGICRRGFQGRCSRLSVEAI